MRRLPLPLLILMPLLSGCGSPEPQSPLESAPADPGPPPLSAYPALYASTEEVVAKLAALDRNVPGALEEAKFRALEQIILLLQFDQVEAAHSILTHTARATANPIEYLYEVAGQLPEAYAKALWPQTPFVVIENFETGAPVHLAELYAFQERETISGEVVAGAGFRGSTGYRIRLSESRNPDQRCLVGLRVASFPVPARPFGLRVRVKQAGAPDLHFVAGYAMRGVGFPTEVRMDSPSFLGDWMLFDSGESYFDVKRQVARQYFSDHFFAISPSMRTSRLSQIAVALQYVGVDVAPGAAAEVVLDDIEIYLPPQEIIDELGAIQEEEVAVDRFLNDGFTRHHRDPSVESADALAAEEIDALNALGYIGAQEAATQESGVVIHDPARTYAGLNFYQSGHGPVSILMDMDGEERYRWELQFDENWPSGALDPAVFRNSPFRRAKLLPNGDVLAVNEGRYVLRMDKHGHPLWVRAGNYHHDLELISEDKMYVLWRVAHILSDLNPHRPILEDYVAELDPRTGEERRRVSILRAFTESEFAPHVADVEMVGDVFHTNDLEVLDGRLAEKHPAFKAGNVMLSVSELATIGVLDMETEKIVWALEGEWGFFHHPTVLDNGHVLLFDNWSLVSKGLFRASRVMEVDVFTPKIVWEYAGNRNRQFYSLTCGANQKLPNGNILISETDNGVAIEVTPGHEVVWRFVNPYRGGENNDLVAKVFEMHRLPADFPLDWMEPGNE